MGKTVRITIRLPEEDVDYIDTFVGTGEFSNRSEFIRRAIRKHTRETAPEVTKASAEKQELAAAMLRMHQVQNQMDEMKRAIDRLAQK